MKKILSALFILLSIVSFAQHRTCFTMDAVTKLRATNPNYDEQMQVQEDAVRKFQATGQQDDYFAARAVRTIPVVVHVIYNTAAQNISTATIQAYIAQLNADYAKTNSDFNTARTAVQGLAANTNIQFCLAQQTPSGAATTGINRVSTTHTCWDSNTETDDMKSTATGGATAWDVYHYLNIWVVHLCGSSPQTGGVGGYSYIPAAGNGLVGNPIDGVVVDYSIGLNNLSNRAWTHEVGHYLGLHHTWGDLAANACGNVFPATDDGYSDTPDSKAANFGCTPLFSCAGNSSYGDLLEDFMDYSDCTVMFTTMQANAMNSILSGVRSALVTNNNKCGIVGAPTAAFTAAPTSICTGQTVTFTNTSTGTNNTYSWSFQGGTPTTSTATNPTVTYNTAGTYSVTLTATNANGTNTSTQASLIVVSGSNALPLTEGFEASTFPPSGWSLNNVDAATTWARTTSASGFGTSTASAYMYNFNYNAAGQKDWLITPSYNFTGVTNGRIKWDFAYGPYNQAGYNDSLIVLYSTNCGVSWTTLWGKGGSALGTATATANSFVPSAAQWKKDSVSLAALSGQTNVRFAFKNACQYGNNIYLDNVNIYNASAQAGLAPVADFVGTPTTVVVGNTVAFTDLSTNTPTSWAWSFTSGTPATSTAQNPTITYNTVGVYPVTLTATNGNGSNPITKTAYITVIAAGASTCDTLSNIFAAPADTLRLYLSNNWGYLAGHNGYGDLAKAERYDNVTTAQLSGAFFYFAHAHTNTPATSHITASVWDATGAGGSPGTLLATQNVLISTIATDVTNLNLTYVTFATPATVTGNFYIGFSMTYVAGDTVGLVTTDINNIPLPNYGWELQSNNTWYNYNDANSWGLDLDNFILPVLCTASGNAPTASFTANNTAVCAGSSVTFTSTSTGNPTSYSWTLTGASPAASSAQNPTVSYNTAGTYNVALTASNANGSNTSTQNSYITVYAKPTLTTSSPTSVLCFGGSTGSASVTATGATSYTYSWSGGGTTATISNKPAGTYTVTVTDNHSCSSTASVNINQPLAALTLTPSTTDASCGQNNGVATVTATGGSGGNTYHWQNNATTASITNLAAGTYSVTVTDVNNCTAATTMVVGTAANTLTVTIQTTNAGCGFNNGTALALPNNVLSGISYAWSTSSTAGNIGSLAAGTYSVTVTNGNGCTASASATITNVASNISVTFNSSPAACSQSTGSITATPTGGSGGYTYSWTGGGTSATISNQAAGSYTVTVTDNSGCSSTAVGTISNANAPTVSVTQTSPSCFNGTNGSATASASGGTPGYTYNWSSGVGTANASNLTGGSTYVVTVHDQAQCIAVQSVTITNPASLTVSVAATNALCGNQNGTATANVTGGTGSYTYHWSTNGTSSGITNLGAGNYLITVTDANQCSVTTSAQISNALAPNSILNPVNGTCQVAAQINLTVNGGTGPFTYIWSNGATTKDIQGLNAGTFSVTITDANGCTNTNSVAVTDASNVSVSFTSQNPTQGNSDGSVTANPSGGSGPYTYLWNTGSQLQTLLNIPAGTYTVTVTDNAGCSKVSSITISSPNGIAIVKDIALIKIYPNPTKDICNVYLELYETQNVNVEIFNNLGQQVWFKQMNDFKQGTEAVDVNKFSAGVYFIKIHANNSVQVVRFIKD
ncbi:MAG: PKD domain-containing protein [Bacteroidetes bacterium]|nr:PKD domain-containing protein [Bacteroidota bacterium]